MKQGGDLLMQAEVGVLRRNGVAGNQLSLRRPRLTYDWTDSLQMGVHGRVGVSGPSDTFANVRLTYTFCVRSEPSP
ncbi:MAG: hypothetical protein GVY24_07205 [Planctomycetes bacterium]|nr:hypothetical protein [Planctomycetota bacterium]